METKKLLNKKITQWLLLVAMLVGCSANALAYDIYVHPSDANHRMYAWDDKSSDGWPGDQFSNTSKFDKYGTWYCWKQHPTKSSQKLIFNCGNNCSQTSNIGVSSTTYYYYTGSTSYSTLSTSNKYYYSELYLDCRSFTDWTKDGAVFRAYFYSNTGCTDGEYIMTVDFSATSTTNVYKATFTCPIPIKGIKFERMKSDKTEGWNNFTINTFSSSYNCGKVTGYNAGSKSFYTPCTTPTASNFNVSGLTTTYNGNEQAPTITPDDGMGTMTVKYDGTAGTGKTDADTYAITVDVAAGSTYCAATGISLGDFVINKANQSALTFNGSTECVDTEVTLSATGGSSGETITYKKKSGTGTVTGNKLTTSTAGTVVVTATCPGGTNYNDETKDATFTFVAKPVAGTVTGGGDICTAGKGTQTQTLTVAGYSGSIQWQKADSESGSYSDISSATSTTYVAGAAGWYRVKVSNAQCDPVYSNAVEVVGYSSTVAGNVSGTTTICSGESATLTASGYKGTIRFWMVSTDGGSNWTNLTGETSSTYTPTNITTTSKYKVSVNGICGSGGSGSATVTVNPLNNVSNITFSPSSVKKGETTEATATVTTVGGTGKWSTTTGSLISFSSTSDNPTTITANGIGTAKVTYTLTGGCSGTNYKTVDLVINSDCDAPDAGTISGDNAICAGGTVSLSVTGYTSTNTTLQWNKNGTPVAGKTSNTYTESNVTESATYTVTVTRTDVDNCSKTTDAGYEVTVTAIPTITAQGGERCGNGNVTLQATATPVGCTVNWYDAATGGTKQGEGLGKEVNVTVGSPVTLYAEAVTTDAAACKSASRASATATAKLVPSIASITKTDDACGAGDIKFTANGVTASSEVEWFENSVSVGTGGSKTFSGVPAGTSHTVTAKATLNGCESAETTPVTGTRKAVPSLTVTAPSAAYGWENATFTVTGDGTITGSVTQTAGSGGIINDKTFKGHVNDTFRASYTATGDNGCTTQKSAEVTVERATESCD